jgi:hypothetical protein
MAKWLGSWPVLVLLAVAAAVTVPRPGHAGFTVKVFEDNQALDTYNLPSGQSDISKTYADFKLVFTAVSSNSPGSAVQGELKFSALDVISTSGNRHQIIIDMQDDTFTNPGAAGDTMTLKNSLTVVSDAAGAGGDNLLVFSKGDGVRTDSARYDSTRNATPFAQSTSIDFVRGTPYTLFQEVSLGLSAGGDITLQTDAAAFVPAPASLVLLLSGVPFGLGGCWLTRRRS